MSGGSYDYAYMHIDELAGNIRENGHCHAASPGLRLAFKKHLFLVAKACKAIEWNDSCDGNADETKLIEQCLGLSTDKSMTKNFIKSYGQSKCTLCSGTGKTGDVTCSICDGDGKFHPEKYTCNGCLGITNCPYSWDSYNTDGDCLLEK